MALPDIPDSKMVSIILSEINMNERDLDDAVISMKQWITKQPHLPPVASDDKLLKAFIIGCKSVERAKIKLDNCFTYRNTYHDLVYKNRDTMAIKWNAAKDRMLFLPGLTADGSKVAFMQMPHKTDLEEYDCCENLRVQFMLMDLMIRDNYMISGFHAIVDFSNLSVELVLKISLSVAATGAKIVQDACPARMKSVIMINAPPMAETFVNTFLKPFFSKKLKERFHVHSEDHKVLSKYIPLEMLPSDYSGGKSPSIQTQWAETRKKLESERDWFLNEGSQSVNERLRPMKTSEEMMGTFRKLQID